jgi:hypothetical protein
MAPASWAMAVNTQGDEPMVVRGEPDVRSMKAHLLSGEREHPAVALTRSADSDEFMLTPRHVRSIVGSGPRIYLIPTEYVQHLQRVLGAKFALPPGAVRVWWPGLLGGSDPGEHPLVLQLDPEPAWGMLGEFARHFDLSRPFVRYEIRLIEDARKAAERELAQALAQICSITIEHRRALAPGRRIEKERQADGPDCGR